MKHFFPALIILCLISVLWGKSEKDLIVNQTNVPLVTINDSDLISFFLDEFFIPETLVTRMDIIDVSLNGFGENDIVKLYPSDQIYFLPYVTDKAQRKMNEWKFTANFQITANNKDISILEDYDRNKPAYNLYGAILKGLHQNYKDYPIKIRFERDSSTVLFELWSYNQKLLAYIPDDSARLKDPVMEKIITTSDTTYRDCIFIYKTLKDTVFIPIEKSND